MRQVGDMLVWLGLILVVAGVVYFTPRFANYVASERSEHGRESKDFARDGLPAVRGPGRDSLRT